MRSEEIKTLKICYLRAILNLKQGFKKGRDYSG